MLIPAILKKDEIENAMRKYYYTDDMMYETGSLSNWCPMIKDDGEEGLYQYAIIDGKNKLVGYLSFNVNWYASNATGFGVMSFDRGNPAVGMALKETLNSLINIYKLHRIEWRMVGGNPVERHYDAFIKKYNGRKLILRDAIKDRNGKYHDDVIYEIILNEALAAMEGREDG